MAKRRTVKAAEKAAKTQETKVQEAKVDEAVIGEAVIGGSNYEEKNIDNIENSVSLKELDKLFDSDDSSSTDATPVTPAEAATEEHPASANDESTQSEEDEFVTQLVAMIQRQNDCIIALTSKIDELQDRLNRTSEIAVSADNKADKYYAETKEALSKRSDNIKVKFAEYDQILGKTAEAITTLNSRTHVLVDINLMDIYKRLEQVEIKASATPVTATVEVEKTPLINIKPTGVRKRDIAIGILEALSKLD